MKVDQDVQSSSKLDMSLDDIIKLDKKKARAAKQAKQNPKNNIQRQRFSTNRQRLHVPAVGIRLRSLRQNRLPQINAKQRQSFANNRSNFSAQSNQSTRFTALAVLRRARQTAVAAAKAASAAASLIQRNRLRRQTTFDERRGIQPTSRIATERRPSRNRMTSNSFRIPRVNYNRNPSISSHSTSLSRPPVQVTPNFQRRLARGPRQQFDTYDGGRRFGSSAANGYSRASVPRVPNRGRRANYRAYNRNQSRGGYVLPATRHPSRYRARNAEYLAQARALIQAQAEQSQANRSNNSTPRSSWTSRSQMNPRRNLNYYAQFWDNAR